MHLNAHRHPTINCSGSNPDNRPMCPHILECAYWCWHKARSMTSTFLNTFIELTIHVDISSNILVGRPAINQGPFNKVLKMLPSPFGPAKFPTILIFIITIQLSLYSLINHDSLPTLTAAVIYFMSHNCHQYYARNHSQTLYLVFTLAIDLLSSQLVHCACCQGELV